MIIIAKQEKGTYLLSIEILLGPNEVYLYLTLSLGNFTAPKNYIHLTFHTACLLYSQSFEHGTFGVPPGVFL